MTYFLRNSFNDFWPLRFAKRPLEKSMAFPKERAVAAFAFFRAHDVSESLWMNKVNASQPVDSGNLDARIFVTEDDAIPEELVYGWAGGYREDEFPHFYTRELIRVDHARELSAAEKQKFFARLKQLSKLDKAQRIWWAQHEDCEGDIPARGLANLKRHEHKLRVALGMR